MLFVRSSLRFSIVLSYKFVYSHLDYAAIYKGSGVERSYYVSVYLFDARNHPEIIPNVSRSNCNHSTKQNLNPIQAKGHGETENVHHV